MSTFTDVTMSKTSNLVDKLDKLRRLQAEALANAKKWTRQAETIAGEIEQVTKELSS